VIVIRYCYSNHLIQGYRSSYGWVWNGSHFSSFEKREKILKAGKQQICRQMEEMEARIVCVSVCVCASLAFSKLFDPKTGFFDSKTQTLHTFFENFEIYTYFWIISELKFLNFFTKILRVQKLRFFPKKIPNFDNRTFPKLAKTKSLENPV